MTVNTVLFKNVRIIGSDSLLTKGWLFIRDDRILSFGRGLPPQNIQLQADKIISAGGQLLMPGFIDLHTHGAAGVDFIEATVGDLQRVSQFYASHGVTGFLATTWSASPDVIQRTLENVRAVMGHEKGSALLGIHLEGPFINPARAGAQSPREIRAAQQEEVLPYLDSGLVKVISLAPEIQENQWLICACQERGITTAAAHSDATYDEMRIAVELGLQHVTHCFNAMRSFNHREPGVMGAALEMEELSCEIIADKVHVHPAAIRLLLRAKQRNKVVLVTDSIAGTGTPDGIVEIQDKKIRYTKQDARLLDGTLAGSVLTMDGALRNLVEISGEPVEKVWMCSSRNAAMVIRLDPSKGVIQPEMSGSPSSWCRQ